jgi:hypothetical protein
MTDKRDAHDARMDQLARKVSRLLHGEDLFDVACVCALVTAYAIKESYPTRETRHVALEKIHEFMVEHINFQEESDERTT